MSVLSFTLHKALSEGLQRKLRAGEAHWVTVKEGPLKGRHLLIEGARPAKGQTSHGKILAGHGIPAHVIEKITGATHAHHLDHEVSEGPPPTPLLHEHLQAQKQPFQGSSSGYVTTGQGFQTQTNAWGKKEAIPGHVRIGVSKTQKDYLAINSAYADKDALKRVGARWGPAIGSTFKQWYLPINRLPDLLRTIPHAEVTPEAVQAYEAHHKGADHPDVAALRAYHAAHASDPVNSPPGLGAQASTPPRPSPSSPNPDPHRTYWAPVEEALQSYPAAQRQVFQPVNATVQVMRPSRGKQDRIEPGRVVLTRQGVGIVVQSRKIFDDDGAFSAEGGWQLVTTVRPPETPDEWKRAAHEVIQEIQRHEAEVAQRRRQERVQAIAQDIRRRGTVPTTRQKMPAGDEVIVRPWTAYGGGESLVLDPAHHRIWAIRNNGADGDDWSRNNIETAGAGAIGAYIPWDDHLAQELQSYGAQVVHKSRYHAPLYFPIAKGYLTTAYGEGRAPAKTPDAGKRVHQLAAISGDTTEESLPMVRLYGFTPNTVWTLLHEAGYRLRITEGQAMLPGQTTVRVTPNGAVTFRGPKAAAYARWLDGHLHDMVDWAGQIDGKQEVSSIRAHGGHFS